ncbi:DUF2160 domain-containing protein [Fodinicurvata halophila]|uniref:DUF2160 domain-containing protein n=1 Tax=Fodinicurvata halophila TaxID=1419723 RepID=UPI00362DDD0F
MDGLDLADGTFFTGIVLGLVVMSLWQQVSPTMERVGILGIATTRGDRFFISLLGSAYIHVLWIGFVDLNLLWASALSILYAVAVFRWV